MEGLLEKRHRTFMIKRLGSLAICLGSNPISTKYLAVLTSGKLFNLTGPQFMQTGLIIALPTTRGNKN